jgi:hypothetical protein
LFVAPCSHVWHYKCIRPILNGPTWPNFLCPNCRAVADLEEDVEDPPDFEDWEEDVDQPNEDSSAKVAAGEGDRHITPRASMIQMNAQAPVNGNNEDDGGVGLSDLQQAISNFSISESLNAGVIPSANNPQTPDRRTEPQTSSVTQPVQINVISANEFSGLSPLYPNNHDGLTPGGVSDGPMTPRNDAGPFVLDGSAGRAGGSRLRDISPGSDSGSTRSANGAPSLPPMQLN